MRLKLPCYSAVDIGQGIVVTRFLEKVNTPGATEVTIWGPPDSSIQVSKTYNIEITDEHADDDLMARLTYDQFAEDDDDS